MKSKAITILTILFTLSFLLTALQSISITSGGESLDLSSETDPVLHIRNGVLDSNGNMIVSGQTQKDDAFVAKLLSDSGESSWELIMGGSEFDIIEDILIDSQDNTIIFGNTASNDFTIQIGDQSEIGLGGEFQGGIDLFIVKINPEGELIWTRYWGGSGHEFIVPYLQGIYLDKQDNIIISGTTNSSDLILTDPIQQNYGGTSVDPAFEFCFVPGDSFLAKFTRSGVEVFSTYLGGSDRELIDIRFDSLNNIIAVGATGSADFLEGISERSGKDHSVNCELTDIHVEKITEEGDLLWSHLLGGRERDLPQDVLIDSNDNIILMGSTESDDWPVSPNAHQTIYGGQKHDQFITKISSSGIIEWNTYFGGSDRDRGDGPAWGLFDDQTVFTMPIIKLDSENNIILLSQTQSDDLNTTSNAIQRDHPGSLAPYVVKFTTSGDLEFSTFLAGSIGSVVNNLLIGFDDTIIITGAVVSSDYPVSHNAFQNRSGGASDVVISTLTKNGSMIWSTYLGGSQSDVPFSSIDRREYCYCWDHEI